MNYVVLVILFLGLLENGPVDKLQNSTRFELNTKPMDFTRQQNYLIGHFYKFSIFWGLEGRDYRRIISIWVPITF